MCGADTVGIRVLPSITSVVFYFHVNSTFIYVFSIKIVHLFIHGQTVTVLSDLSREHAAGVNYAPAALWYSTKSVHIQDG